jgi:uncharacterized protein (DUF433 family)
LLHGQSGVCRKEVLEMQTLTEVVSVEVNESGLAEISGTGVLVGDVLTLTFLYRWTVEDLINYYTCLTSEMINAAFEFAATHPDAAEGQFYFSIDPCRLMRALGLI